jgi:hypothetical protein
MFDISIPWSVILWMAPILMPYLSIPGALLAGFAWYRRNKSVYAALLAAVVGAFGLPWAGLAVIVTVEGLGAGMMLTPRGLVVVALIVLLALAGLVIWGVSHAGSRRREN